MGTLSSSIEAQHARFILLQSSAAQSALPILRSVLADSRRQTLLVCLLYPWKTLLPTSTGNGHPNVGVLDFVESVPGICEGWKDPRVTILEAANKVSGPVTLVIDSLNAICADVTSNSDVYCFLTSLLSILSQKTQSSQLFIHALNPLPIVETLLQTRFSSTVTHIIAHPPSILEHIAREYFAYPPPVSSPDKFWSVFSPLSARLPEVENLIFGTSRVSKGDGQEFVVEVIARGQDRGSRKRKGVETTVGGWRNGASVDLIQLPSLDRMWPKNTIDKSSQDPDHLTSFNVNLTPSQQEARSKVPLPYAHEGKPDRSPNQGSNILYDPDSADDIDDDDPDEDLDI